MKTNNDKLHMFITFVATTIISVIWLVYINIPLLNIKFIVFNLIFLIINIFVLWLLSNMLKNISKNNYLAYITKALSLLVWGYMNIIPYVLNLCNWLSILSNNLLITIVSIFPLALVVAHNFFPVKNTQHMFFTFITRVFISVLLISLGTIIINKDANQSLNLSILSTFFIFIIDPKSIFYIFTNQKEIDKINIKESIYKKVYNIKALYLEIVWATGVFSQIISQFFDNLNTELKIIMSICIMFITILVNIAVRLTIKHKYDDLNHWKAK